MLPTSVYDERRADFAVKFINLLKHTSGEFHGRNFTLLPWQERIVRDIFGIVNKDTGFRQFRTVYCELAKKNGKLLALHTPIPTPNGFTTMGDVQVGDLVFDERGMPTKIIAKSEVDYSEQAYRITFKDGEVIEAGENHQWFGEYTRGKRYPCVLTTRQLAELPRDDGCFRFRIPIAGYLETPERELPIDPYLMGYWLGNGTATSPRITVQTKDIAYVLGRISKKHEVTHVWDNVGDSLHFNIPALKPILLKSFHDKVIPPAYLRGSREQRLALLQGLMDSDGCIGTRKGQANYVSTEKALAESVSELLWTLGIKNAITKDVATVRRDWSGKGKERGRIPAGEVCYYVKFTAFTDIRAAGLERKQCNAVPRNPGTRSHFRYIDKIEPIENTGMQCIQVASRSHLYLCGRSCLPTHNSELAAAIALYCLLADGEMGAEVYGAAADVNQASIVYQVARHMVEQSPALSGVTKLLPSTKKITFPRTNSFYRVLSSEVKTKYGLNPSAVIFDELCAQPTRDLYDTLTKLSGDARRQPLFFIITTAGREKTSICYEIHCKAKAVLDGSLVDPAFYPVIYGMDAGDDWNDPEVWKKCNPSLGVTIPFETVQAAYEQAKLNPADELHYRQFRLNEWTNADVRWMPMDKWDACGTLEPEGLIGRTCYAGLDLSSTSDLTALVLVFPPTESGGVFSVLPYFWLPEEAIALRTRRDHVPYRQWGKAGVFYTTPGAVVDYAYIVKFIEGLCGKFHIRELAFDRWGAEKIRRDLEELGDERGFTVFQFGQGYASMSPPTKDLMQLVQEKKLAHAKHPVLDWCLQNAIAEQDPAGNIKLSKRKSTEKIDGAIALVMALARATVNAGDRELYADRRPIFFI